MEPLVVVSAVIVLVYGYRTGMEVLREVEGEGSWALVRESARSYSGVGVIVAKRLLHRAEPRKLSYYNNFFLETRTGQPRALLLKRHA